MNGIRWYAMDSVTYTPLVSPITRAPYVITLPDRAAALAWCARSFPQHVVTPMSVMEYDAMREMASQRTRFLKRDDEQRAIAIAREEIQRAVETGQGELLTEPTCWRERRAA